ncbi:sigma 54-interacting transcriptional regulator [Traorella massiliensis]|uniref:sigma-54-dependent Fis family transcriptional regulator n=1 Tax=Traorella massiliensis TaxID=1903263 RepID=UPI00248ED331|nr:sigma 54-interacting transcriptional regulator [Traorella massiliensis]
MDIVKQAWETYVAHSNDIPDHIEGVRDEIIQSWKRCKQQLDPFQKQMSFVSSDILEKKMSENALLIKIAYSYLLEFYHYLQSTDYQIFLVDKEGCQLKRIADNKQQDKFAKEKQLFDGCLYTEEKAGTNGISVCLQQKRPVMVIGSEHYLEIYHNVVCYSAPIYDFMNQIIACLLIVGPLSSFNPMIMGMLSAAVAGIEKEFELTTTNHLLNSTMESLNSAVLVLDHQQKIIHFNQQIFRVLQLSKQDLTNKSIYDIINYDSLPEALRSFQEAYTNIECTLINSNQVHVDVSLTIKPQSMDSTLILIDLQNEVHRLANQLAGTTAIYTFEDIQGTSKAIENLKLLGKTIASSDQPALIFGEAGTGKDMVAQSIHNASSHKTGPFVSVNCSTVQKGYLEAELWGSGDLTDKKPGKLELAQKGTLFLVEVSNLSMDAQEKLYHFIKTNEFINPLTNYKKKLNVRILASTSKNLYALVEKGMFRQDLYYALNGLHITIPPLRERMEDVLVLSKVYVKQYSESLGIEQPMLSAESLDALMHYQWPGNVRQLESVIDCAVNASNGKEIGLNSLPLDIINDYYAEKNSLYFYASNRLEKTDSSLHPKAQEYNQILYAMKASHGNVKKAAEALHMSLSTFYRKINKYHIYPKDFEKRI